MTPETLEVPPQAVPNIDDVVIDDGAPVDGMVTEKNMRLLTSPLYASWAGPGDGRPFVVLANVGLFHAIKQPPVVPDVMLSLDVEWPDDLSQKVHNSYFVWFIGKFPEVAIEIVSNLEGGEDTTKMKKYERLKILYYVIFDPENLLGGGVLRAFQFDGRKYRPTSAAWLEEVGLGLKLWEGAFEGQHGTWLRWCDSDGQVIPTGEENTETERQRANEERQRANEERQRANEERQRAEQATQRAEQAQQEAERLRVKLRELGIEPPA